MRAKRFEAYVQQGSIAGACRLLGIDRRRFYDWKDQDPAFEDAMKEALVMAEDELLAAAFERATNGKSDVLLMFLLKALKPEVYRNPRPTPPPPPPLFSIPLLLNSLSEDGMATFHRLLVKGLHTQPSSPAP